MALSRQPLNHLAPFDQTQIEQTVNDQPFQDHINCVVSNGLADGEVMVFDATRDVWANEPPVLVEGNNPGNYRT